MVNTYILSSGLVCEEHNIVIRIFSRLIQTQVVVKQHSIHTTAHYSADCGVGNERESLFDFLLRTLTLQCSSDTEVVLQLSDFR